MVTGTSILGLKGCAAKQGILFWFSIECSFLDEITTVYQNLFSISYLTYPKTLISRCFFTSRDSVYTDRVYVLATFPASRGWPVHGYWKIHDFGNRSKFLWPGCPSWRQSLKFFSGTSVQIVFFTSNALCFSYLLWHPGIGWNNSDPRTPGMGYTF